ncbi:hypothetical protein ABTX77_40855 [Streptomyces sp. NPDC097704]|uniref:hypothetical protein n=1 Tax=Streptomyces sp. NPDC097704 TaxID=3157101 RepID=UPI0033193D62
MNDRSNERASVRASTRELRDHPTDDPVHPPEERQRASGSRRLSADAMGSRSGGARTTRRTENPGEPGGALMNAPDRGSSKSGPRLDDARKKEVEGLLRSGHPTRVEEWRDPEPPVDEPAEERGERRSER